MERAVRISAWSLIAASRLMVASLVTALLAEEETFTWIQLLGILFNFHKFTLEATKAATWNREVDHLKFSYNGEDLVVSEGALSVRYSPEKDVKVERVANKNTVIVTMKDNAEIMVNVVPVTKEDDRIHNYSLPAGDCFAHLELQFKFFALSPMVDGVLGRTYRPDFENLPSLVSQCLFWVAKISIGQLHFSLRTAELVCSHQKVVQTKRPYRGLNLALFLTVPMGPLPDMESFARNEG